MKRRGPGICSELIALSPLMLAACADIVPGAPARCQPCAISVEFTRTFGELDGPQSFSGDPVVRQDGRRRLYVANAASFNVLVFDSAGTHVATVGRRGSGPGEFEVLGMLAIDRFDTVFAFDRRLFRATVIAPDHAVVRTSRADAAAGANSLGILPSGRFVVAPQSASRGRGRQPIHVLGRNFETERSFGADVGTAVDPDPLRDVRVLAIGDSGEVWSARLREHLFERWDASGVQLKEIRYTSDWLRPEARGPQWRHGEPLPPPLPTISAIDIDLEGYLWVLGSTPDVDWKAPDLERVGTEYKAVNEQPPDDAYDTIIEVFDTTTGRLVASLRHPLHFNQFIGHRALAHRDEREDGRFLISSYDLRLTPVLRER